MNIGHHFDFIVKYYDVPVKGVHSDDVDLGFVNVYQSAGVVFTFWPKYYDPNIPRCILKLFNSKRA